MARSKTRFASSAPPERTFFTDHDLGKRFAALLSASGVQVEVHARHFPEEIAADSTADADWLGFVGEKGWVLLTHDKAMRHTSRERDAIMLHGVQAFMLMGTYTVEDHAENFLRTRSSVERALKNAHGRPFIAKLYLPTPKERATKRNPKGRIEIWLSWEEWQER